MYKRILRYCATDKEIYDALMSAKKQITETVLLELAKDRGIFYSPKDSRKTLASNLSLLLNDYYDLNAILGKREHPGRTEKLTSVILNAPLSIEDIKDVCTEYKEQAPDDESILTNQHGTNKYILKSKYSEIDYSKTSLIQRRQKEAEIEFIIAGDKTIIRSPANDKANDIVANLRNRLDNKKETAIPAGLIELTDFDNLTRTQFFTSLITMMQNFQLVNVTSVNVESSIKEYDEAELELEEDKESEEAEQKMLALVKNVALRGKSLLASDEYRQLKEKGFYITNIIWQSNLTIEPYNIVEFEAGFEETENLTGFKYNVRGARNFTRGQYTKTIRRVSPEEKQEFLSLIEHTSHSILADIQKKSGGDIEKESFNGDKK